MDKVQVVESISKMNAKISNYAYDTSDILGHGSFAIVYKGCRTVEPFDEVAVKRVGKEKAAKNRGLIAKEIKILNDLSKLKHENIVALHECCETPMHVYLVMELCYGGDLNDYLQAKKGPLPEATLKLFVRQLARGIRTCYHMDIMHRDLKPQNILLDVKGVRYPPAEEITLKIADFGFARFIGEGAMAETLCGSPMYMAPEVLMSLKYTGTVDLFSLGTIIYQCFTYRAPFPAKTPHELKEFYERMRGKWKVDFPDRCPEAPDLKDLLRKLLRSSEERISYEKFFEHPFVDLEPFEQEMRNRPLHGDQGRVEETCLMNEVLRQQNDKYARNYPKAASPLTKNENEHFNKQLNQDQPYNINMHHKPCRYSDAVKSDPIGVLEEEDDFVIVPRNIPFDNEGKNAKPRTPLKRISSTSPVHRKAVRGQHQLHDVLPRTNEFKSGARLTCGDNLSCSCKTCKVSNTLPIGSLENFDFEVAKEVQELNSNTAVSIVEQVNTPEITHATKISDTIFPNVASMSPPAVQFILNSPSANSRRKSSHISSTTRYSPCSGTVFHVSDVKHTDFNTADDINVAKQPHNISEMNKEEKDICGNNYPRSKHTAHSAPSDNGRSELFLENFCKEIQVQPLSSLSIHRSVTDPAIQGNNFEETKLINRISSCDSQLNTSSTMKYPISCAQNFNDTAYYAPPLCPETPMDKEHRETLAKLHFVIALVECIFELAKSRSFFYTSLTIAARRETIFGGAELCQNEDWPKKTEQLALYVRALQLISSAISMAQKESEENRLKSSMGVEEATRILTENFNSCYRTCHDLNVSGDIMRMDEDTCAMIADKLIYYYSLEMCQNAAMNELFGKPDDSFKSYQTAHILLHALAQEVTEDGDRDLINLYKNTVEKRLFILQRSGVVQAVLATNDEL